MKKAQWETDKTVQDQIRNHPCYSTQAHRHFARLHLPVAPACNIQCHYCNRKFDCANESRPGVVTELLTPEQAVHKALVVGDSIPHLAVVGIAGPGDPLANSSRTFATFRALSAKAPDLKLCLSTNGLTLPQHVEELVKHNISHVTITINCLDPDIGARIYPWITWNRHRVYGREAAEILIEQQQKGLEMLVARNVLVKVNSVLIPDVNDHHLEEVSQVVRRKGAFLHNIVPLMAKPEYGTHYGLSGQREPTSEELLAVQQACGATMRMMRHCSQCRADAIGKLGQDRGNEFSLQRIANLQVDHRAAQEKRARVRTAIDRRLELQQTLDSNRTSAPIPIPHRVKHKSAGNTALIAVASRDGKHIDQHFGHARSFLIYRVSAEGIDLLERRSAAPYCAGPDTCGQSDNTLSGIIRALKDCHAVLCAKVGFEPWQHLEAAGIQPNSEHGFEPILDAVATVYRELPEHITTPSKQVG